jgi:Asp-tRNA(Asn)/Glu-tRNA(Gln) amidotransferase A subunit family amidase
MADDLWQRSACELAEGIAQRKFSCRDAMASVASRIRARNGALNAIVYDYTEEAMAEARRADEELAAGRVRGPLHGVPVTIKEKVDQQGKPTPNGLPAFEKVIAPDDAPVVRNLKTAGAINYLGLPAGVVPVGLVEGLPAGIQIVGRRFREDLVLDAMAVVERHVGVLARTLWQRES